MNWFVAIILVGLSLGASADVLHYSLCTLRDGKTLADASAWQAECRTVIAKHKIEYRSRVLVAHADGQAKANQFFLEGASPTLVTHAKAWDWWYTHSDASALNTKLSEIATCESGTIYRAVD
jgi:hypothetical protein